MKNYAFEILGFSVALSGPESVEEYNQISKRGTSACLDDAIANTAYRGSHPGVRSDFCKALGDKTGIDRKTRDTGKARKVIVKEADGSETESQEPIVEWAETERNYVERVIATLCAKDSLTEEQVRASLQPLIDSIAKDNPIDPSVREREASGPKKVPQKWIDVAKNEIANGRGDSLAAGLSAKLGIAVAADVDSLSRGIAENERRKTAAAVKDYTV